MTRRRDFHTGIDIKTPGQNNTGGARRTVEYSGWMNGYGRVVVIDHGTIIRPCTLTVAPCGSQGPKVSQGQAIATVSTTGRQPVRTCTSKSAGETIR